MLLDKSRARCAVENLDASAGLAVADSNRKNSWKRPADDSRKAIQIMRKKKIALKKKLVTFRRTLICALKIRQHHGEKQLPKISFVHSLLGTRLRT